MKKLIALGFAVLLGACAAQNDEAAATDKSNLSEELTTPSSVPNLHSCHGKKECIDSLVLRALFSSDLMLDAESNNSTPRLAREVTAEWLAKENDGRVKIREEAEFGGLWTITVVLSAGHETKEDEGDSVALIFTFTLDRGAIVEKSVRGGFAG